MSEGHLENNLTPLEKMTCHLSKQVCDQSRVRERCSGEARHQVFIIDMVEWRPNVMGSDLDLPGQVCSTCKVLEPYIFMVLVVA